MKLSDTKLRAAEPGSKIIKLSDGNGLQFWILPSGTRVWHRAYRIDGKQRDARLGEYPAMTLQEARAANLDIEEPAMAA